MKKFITFFIVALFLLSDASFAQLAKNSWNFGFGFRYPRMINANYNRDEVAFGGYLHLQRNFSEHVGGRFTLSALNFKGKVGATEVSTLAMLGNLDLVYYLVPCESVSPFFTVGVGYGYASYTNGVKDSNLDYEIGGSFGVEFKLNEKWNLKTELAYHTMSNGQFEGVNGTNGFGLLGGAENAYMFFDIGLNYYFKKGEESKLCQLYDGIRLEEMPDPVDYERIANIVKKYIPREVVKEVVVEKEPEVQRRWVLVGVNFDFNSARLTQESYPILFHAVQVLLQNPDMKVEIQGYTDNIGPESYNVKLSERRAKTVKNYLVARGVAASRLTVKGYGSKNPIGDNKTATGRAMNRRIEFKVLN